MIGRVWVVWLALVFTSFLVIEGIGYWRFGGEAGTLSAHIRNWSYYHPLIPFLMGAGVGALAWHFYSVSGK